MSITDKVGNKPADDVVNGLIMKPQYDLKKFTPGTAIHVRSRGAKDPFYDFEENCLVINAEPLKIGVVYASNKFSSRHLGGSHTIGEEDYNSYRTIEIPIEQVAEGKLIITFLGGK